MSRSKPKNVIYFSHIFVKIWPENSEILSTVDVNDNDCRNDDNFSTNVTTSRQK
jgi:hypothetical protein